MTNPLNDSAEYRAERAAEPSDPAQPAEITMSQRDYDERLARRTAGHETDEDLRLIKMYERDGYKPGATATDPEPSAGRTDVARPTHAEDKDAEDKDGDEWRGNSTETSSGSTKTNSGASAKSAPSSARSTASGSKSR